MKFGKLPPGVTGEVILRDLNLLNGEELLFACQATETFNNGRNGPVGVFAFTDGGIYWLDGKGLHRSLKKDQIWGVFPGKHMWMVVSESTKWEITKFEKSDSKFLRDTIANLYPEMELPAMRQAKIIVPESSLDEYTEFDSVSLPTEHLEVIPESSIEDYGHVVVTASFFGKKIMLHSNCYVSGYIFSSPKRFVSISGDYVSVNRKSEVFISIVTEIGTHAVRFGAGSREVSEMQKLITAGETLIRQSQASLPVEVIVKEPKQDLAAQLSSLNGLFQSGVLSEEEFNSAKAKILGA